MNQSMPVKNAFAKKPVKAFQGSAATYYQEAEAGMQTQWDAIIWPILRDFDLTITVDFACGHGRNTAMLARHAKQLYAVDANPEAVAATARRFASFDPAECSIQVILNNGEDLREIPSGTISTLYSFDSMVHFEKRLVELYMPEFARILHPGAKAFIHHSNFGRLSDDPDFHAHPGWRSNVDKDWFARCCWQHGLWPVKQQELDWYVGECMFEAMDCLTVIYKPRA